ncbi:MAG: hypothetical protein CMB80_34530 [Flammeovirgaceae bacterium]|nr:hypothetical protein [Flammeovirgaceae bacterium]HCX21630.1 hypothetical protein [Cytophagales bacterium]|tara:strand:- start:1970 stop:2497 length:528 start_codon:yes stop_codon:yes gene_type:complete
MRFTTSLNKFTESNASVYALHFPVPLEIAEPFIDGENRRIKCTINNTHTISSGLMPFKEYWYILVNQSLQKELQIEVGDSVELLIEKDESKYGMDMPVELETVLDQDKLASEFFHDLTPGKQRNLIYIISKVKNTDSRINKALAIIDHLTERNGKLDFKLLNEKIKEYNQRGKLK